MTRLKIISIIYWILIAGLIVNCEKPKSITGSPELFDRLNKGQVRELTLYPTPAGEAYYYQEPVTGSRSTLMVGNYRDYQTRALLKFIALPDTNAVTTAKLSLNVIKKFGSGSDFPVNVYSFSKEWSETNTKWSELANQFNQELLGSRMISVNDTGKIEISLDPAVLNNWIAAGEDTISMYLDAPEAQFVLQVHSTESATTDKILTMEIIFKPASGLDTLVTRPVHDATLINYQDWQAQGQVQSGQLQIGNGSGARSLVKFDFPDSVLWAKATIHQADLYLKAIPEQSEIESADGILVGFSLVTSELWHSDSLRIDSTLIRPQSYLYQDQEFRVTPASQILNFSGLVQEWTSGRVQNRGLLIRPLLDGENLYFANLNTFQTAKDLGPRLKVVYSLPASPRF